MIGRPAAGKRRQVRGVVGVVAISCGLAACGSSAGSGTTTASSPSRLIVALGDSVPYGTNCDCRPYPALTADGLTKNSGQAASTMNDAVPGYTTSDVLRQLTSDSAVIGHVRAADAVEIEVGANDVAYSSTCGTAVDCYAPKVPTIEQNLSSIVSRVHELTSGHKVLVVLLDYWSVWLGGKYAAAHGDAYVDAAKTMTEEVDAAIKSSAAGTGSTYIDLRAAFKGPDYAYDETHYLSSDGDHPNAAGHQQIATATEAVIENAFHV
jgi:lysophospholipase L1-like esterase